MGPRLHSLRKSAAVCCSVTAFVLMAFARCFARYTCAIYIYHRRYYAACRICLFGRLSFNYLHQQYVNLHFTNSLSTDLLSKVRRNIFVLVDIYQLFV